MNKKTMKIEVTEQEFDLIESIRNYRKSYPNGYPELLDFAQRLFDDLVELPLI